MQEYREIPIGEIEPHPDNPRRKFEGPRFDELVASIREKGVIEPILVRPVSALKGHQAKAYQLVAGERRWRASMRIVSENDGSETTIPAMVRALDDDQAFEIMTIENLQRENLTELEEAESFAAYLKRRGKDAVEDLAARTGIRAAYIRRRVAVVEKLPKNVLEAWDSGKIKYGHLEQLTRLKNKKEVGRAFKEELDRGWTPTVRDFKRRLDNMSPELSKARFDLEKEGCLSCQQNSDVQKQLFELESEKTLCLNPHCFKQKQNNWLTANWKRTGFYKKHKTTGFRFKSDTPYDRFNDLDHTGADHATIVKSCAKCENYITLMELDGSSSYPQTCIGEKKCFDSVIRKRPPKNAKGAGPDAPDGGDGQPAAGLRVGWHGPHFRKEFYGEIMPTRMALMSFDNSRNKPQPLQLALLTLLMANDSKIHVWFAGRNGIEVPEHNPWFKIRICDAWEEIKRMNHKTAYRELRDMAVQVAMDLFCCEELDLICPHMNIDLARDFEVSFEYLRKKTKGELVDLLKAFRLIDGEGRTMTQAGVVEEGQFCEPKAANLAIYVEKQHPKVRSLNALKKGDLVACFTEGTFSLAGLVPDEIWPQQTEVADENG